MDSKYAAVPLFCVIAEQGDVFRNPPKVLRKKSFGHLTECKWIYIHFQIF